jgi:hypothetical protein
MTEKERLGRVGKRRLGRTEKSGLEIAGKKQLGIYEVTFKEKATSTGYPQSSIGSLRIRTAFSSTVTAQPRRRNDST